MSAFGSMLGLAVSARVGTAASSCARTSESKLRALASAPKVPLYIAPPCIWFVPLRVTMLNVRPPLEFSAEPAPIMKLVS
jgi:hypothetical protein